MEPCFTYILRTPLLREHLLISLHFPIYILSLPAENFHYSARLS